MRILLTGASGFIGRHLLPKLIELGHHVIAPSRSPIPRLPRVNHIEVNDLRNPIDWSSIVSEVDVVIHLAGLAHTTAREEDLYATNTEITRSLGRASAKANVRQFIFVSSILAQTGPSSPKVLSEDDEPTPTTAYGRSKLSAENAIKGLNLPFTILRPVVVTGDDVKGNIGTLKRIAKLPIPLPFGGLNFPRSMVSIENIVSAIVFCMENDHSIRETFIVSDPHPTTIAELISRMRMHAGRPVHLFKVPQFLLSIPLSTLGLWEKVGMPLVATSSKIEKAGWKPV